MVLGDDARAWLGGSELLLSRWAGGFGFGTLAAGFATGFAGAAVGLLDDARSLFCDSRLFLGAVGGFSFGAVVAGAVVRPVDDARLDDSWLFLSVGFGGFGVSTATAGFGTVTDGFGTVTAGAVVGLVDDTRAWLVGSGLILGAGAVGFGFNTVSAGAMVGLVDDARALFGLLGADRFVVALILFRLFLILFS
jgi:hypothetical protein